MYATCMHMNQQESKQAHVPKLLPGLLRGAEAPITAKPYGLFYHVGFSPNVLRCTDNLEADQHLPLIDGRVLSDFIKLSCPHMSCTCEKVS